MNPSPLCVKVRVELVRRQACSPTCKVALGLVEDPGGYDVALGARRGKDALQEKAFHFGEHL